MGNDDDKVDGTSVAKSVGSIFTGSLPGIGTVWRGIDTAKNVIGDIQKGEYGKAATDYGVGMYENGVATLFGQAAGAGVRHLAGNAISSVAGEQYRPEESRVVKDVKNIAKEAKKLAPKR